MAVGNKAGLNNKPESGREMLPYVRPSQKQKWNSSRVAATASDEETLRVLCTAKKVGC
ncbi:hypothetical protein [Methylomonas lenta]|uniref:hypothetical protein n=1 Tax=Methylomonas lenta TaxID=980561 RepID=UPI000B1201A9|nr:hypothetical protein [Methylomonas lenta]